MPETDTQEIAATPAQQGYRMPAEWENHEATWIAWPHNANDWPDRFAPIPWVYAEIVRKLREQANDPMPERRRDSLRETIGEAIELCGHKVRGKHGPSLQVDEGADSVLIESAGLAECLNWQTDTTVC